MDELNFLWEKLLCIFRMISNFTIEIARIHLVICEVQSGNSNPGIFFINLANKPGITPKRQGKGNAISLNPLYHFHPLHRHLEVNQAITAESSLQHIAKFLQVIFS